jgi:hypothetical protein
MTRTRIAVSAVALLALLTACGGGSEGSGGTTPSASGSASSSSSAPSETATPTADESTPGDDGTGLPTSLVALQLCGTTLGYAAGALAGVPTDQLTTLETGVASAQEEAGTAEPQLVAQSRGGLEAAQSGDKDALTAAAKTMGDLCGAN